MFLGLVFGDGAPEQHWWRSRAFYAGLMTTGVFTAAALLSYMVAPDWMWMYFADPEEMSGVVKVIPAAYFFTFLLGFAAALGLRRSGRLWQAAGLALAAEGAIVALTWDRYHRIGTKEEWEEGTAAELFATKPEGAAKKIGMLGPLVVGSFVVGLYLARKDRR